MLFHISLGLHNLNTCKESEMTVEFLSVCQFIRNVIRETVPISGHINVINCFKKFQLFLYNITTFVDERFVKFSACIWSYRSATENIFCIRQIVKKTV